MVENLKIVHCGIFNEKENGNFFYGLERKISHGLIQNGHFVYDFSYRDIERNFRFMGIKDSGLKKMNQKLIDICKNIDIDILFLAKSEKIEKETLIRIKELLPNVKIIQWYVDHLEEDEAFFDKLNYIDIFYYANAKDLEKLSEKYKNTIFSFFPNISDPSFDKSINLEKTNDILYIARDHKEDIRSKFAVLLKEFCEKENISYEIFASLNNPPVFGNEFHKAIARAKIAINFNRDDYLEKINKEKVLGASDRMAQFLGSGICTFSPRINGFEKLYVEDQEIVYFDNINDCLNKMKCYLKEGKYNEIARKGQKKTFALTNSKRVTKFMLEVLFKEDKLDKYEWNEYIFKEGKKYDNFTYITLG